MITYEIRFGADGNAGSALLDGWSNPEDGFTWSVGRRSRLKLTNVDTSRRHRLILVGRPYVHEPVLESQRVTVTINGCDVGTFIARRDFVEIFDLPAGTPSSDIILGLECPDCVSPQVHGSADTRRLGVALSALQLLAYPTASQLPAPLPKLVERAKPSDTSHAAAVSRVGNLCDAVEGLLASGNLLLAHVELSMNVADCVVGLTAQDRVSYHLMSLCMITEYDTGLTAVLNVLFEATDIEASFEANETNDPSIARCSFPSVGKCHLSFMSGMRHAWTVSRAALDTLVSYMMAILPLLIEYSKTDRIRGSLNLNLGDEAHVRGIAFCGRTPDVTLIPDPDFLRTRGYADHREHFATTRIDWADRKGVALWRGSSTGSRAGASIIDLERIRLCIHANSPGSIELIDAGVTSFLQVTPAEQTALEKLGVHRPYVMSRDWQEWKYHIDIDGNSNSWSGTFQKLLAGSVVLKVASSGKWRQWYYDLLKPYENFIPIANDLSDLNDKIKYLKYNDQYARSIGDAGRSLALSLTYESQFAKAICLVEQAIVIDSLTCR